MIAAAVLSAAGAAAQMRGQSMAKKAMNNANENELNRQKGFTNESLAQFDNSLKYNQGVDQQARERDASNALNNQYQQTIEQTLSPASGAGMSSDAAPKAIADSYREAMEGAKKGLQSQLAAKAALGGFGTMLGNTQIQNANVANTQNMLGGFMKGSSAVLPLELQHASHAGDGMNNLGMALQVAGALTGMYGSAAAANGGSLFGGAKAAGDAAKAAGAGAAATGSAASQMPWYLTPVSQLWKARVGAGT
jgi:hypothetical protein